MASFFVGVRPKVVNFLEAEGETSFYEQAGIDIVRLESVAIEVFDLHLAEKGVSDCGVAPGIFPKFVL